MRSISAPLLRWTLAFSLAWTGPQLRAQSLLSSPFALTSGAASAGPEIWLADEAAKPGQTVMAGVHLKLPSGWHTYWQNPGDSGVATKITWTLPPGITADAIQWPVPAKDLAAAGSIRLYTYVYRDECVLLVPLHLAPGLQPGPVKLSAEVDWQQCAEVCMPKHAEAVANLTIGDQEKPTPRAADLQKWQDRLPQAKPNVPVKAAWRSPATDANRLLAIEMDDRAKTIDFFPYRGEGYTVHGETKQEQLPSGQLRLTKEVEKDGTNWPKRIRGLIVYNPDAAAPIGFETELDLAESGTSGVEGPAAGSAGALNKLSLATTLFFALVGGLILNIMPCVLPVIALKVLGFVRKSQESPARVRRLGLIYGFGVVTSFIVLAGLAIGVQKAGGLAGWGTALQYPQFRAVMVAVLMLVALNLFGLFEVGAGSSALAAADDLTRKEGSAGAFFNGVLAAILATPCTAPFLSVALAFAFTQPPGVIVLTFIFIGLGLALPFVVLCWNPAFLRFLPKPGAWMGSFKVIMGFPMLATAVWLFWATAPRFGKSGVLWFGLFLVVLSLCAYLWGEFVQRGTRRRALSVLITLGLAVAAYAGTMEACLDWRHPSRADQTGIKWETWSPQAVEKARHDGHPVLVDFTADTCLTCQLNKLRALEIPATRRLLDSIHAVSFIGDFTDENPEIGKVLARFGRPGQVPLVLVYPADPAKPAIVLDVLLTPANVAKALQEAAR